MNGFLVRHVGADGVRETRVTAVDAAEAIWQLNLASAQVLSVTPLAGPVSAGRGPKAGAGTDGRPWLPVARPRRSRLVVQELSVLLDAGIPLLEAFQTLQEKESSPADAKVLADVSAELMAGQPLSRALSRRSDAFDPLLVAMVSAAERSGQVARALASHAAHMAWSERLRAALTGAALYPALLVVASVGVLLFLLLVVVPRFAAVLDNLDQLPAASRWLMQAGLAAAAQPGLAVAAALAVLVLPVLAWRSGPGRAALSSLAERLPVLGAQFRLLALARLYRTLAMLLQSGLPAMPALGLASGVAGATLQPALARMRAAVDQGVRLSDALAQAGLTTPVALRMVRVGERSGDLAGMLQRAADFHDEELVRMTDRLTRLVNPLLMLVMGSLIGGVVVLLYMPIFQLAEQVS
ncbi:MAG: type II secretion system F family protein [Aquabacterium sp.]